MFCSLNRTLRRQRHRLVALALVLGLAGAVVAAHGAMGHDHMGDALVMCLAVAETAVIAVGVAVAFGTRMRRPLWLIPGPSVPAVVFAAAPRGPGARAGPPLLQVFRR